MSYLQDFMNLPDANRAAWVQAGGTIVAIAAAIGIGWWQAKLARESVARAQLIADKARQSGIVAIAAAALEHAKTIGEVFDKPANDIPLALYSVYDRTIITGMARALTRVPVHDVGSGPGVMAFLSLRDQFVFLGKAIVTYQTRVDPETAKTLSDLPGPQKQMLLADRQAILARNIKDRVATIRQYYEALTLAIHNDVVPETPNIIRSRWRWDLIAIGIALVAAAFSGLQWWESHRQNRLASDASIGFEIDTDPADNKLGIGVRNVGPGVATVQSVKYYVDGKQVASIDDAIEAAKLALDRMHPIELTDEAMGPGEIIWIVKYNARKADTNQAADFFENHLNASVDYCTAGGRCVSQCSQTGGCGKSK
jgi:hypothetical protein